MVQLTRLAPTPSGLLHPGNGVSFLLTWALARRAGARILLRIDDLDRARFRPEYLVDIFETLDWLGLDWDEGPRQPSDWSAHWSQHQRIPLYEEALQALKERGMLYACRCSRRERAATSQVAPAACPCRQALYALDEPGCAWRVAVRPDARVRYREQSEMRELEVATLIGDVVVRQKDGMPAYQIASLCDDRHFGVDLIVRGQDLLPSTAAQLYLALGLGWLDWTQATFHHHPLLLDAQGQKLSKSAGAGALRTWRQEGRSPAALVARAAEWLGLSPSASQPHHLLDL